MLDKSRSRSHLSRMPGDSCLILRWTFLFFTTFCSQALAMSNPPVFHYASQAEAVAALRTPDDFIDRLSPFDRSARLKTAGEVSKAAFLDYVSQQAKDWTPEERARVQSALQPLLRTLKDLPLGQMQQVMLVRTTGREEGGAAYTRGSSIILPDSVFNDEQGDLAGLLAHEFMHILSRANPKLRDRLYQVIGFEKCAEVLLPAGLADRKITNPDAPVWTHGIRVRAEGREVLAVPVLLASVTRYPEGRKDEFFQFLSLRFKAFKLDADGQAGEALPSLLGIHQLEGFFEKTGRNTAYIIHPEEILADNFKLLVTGATGVASPEIIKGLRQVLQAPQE